jgi:hypothetical protein
MRSVVHRVLHHLSPDAIAVLVLAVIVLSAGATAALVAPQSKKAEPAVNATSTAAVDAMPRASARAPEVGNVIFRTSKGVWRYDGGAGTVRRIGVYGRPTADKRQYIVRADDEMFYLADAASGTFASLAPSGTIDVDWIGGGRPMAFVGRDQVTLYFGVREQVMALPGAQFVRVSPDGRRAIVGTMEPHAAAIYRLVVIEFASDQPRTLVTLPVDARGLTLNAGAWSPNGRYFAYFVESMNASLNADGVGLRIVDAFDGQVTELGMTIFDAPQLAWAAPHTLAYISGAGRETWLNKTLRVWSPEDGVHDITRSTEVGLNPSWSPDGRTLYFVRAEAGAYDALEFFAAKASGDRRIAAYDVRSGNTMVFGTQAADVSEGVRAARSGSLMLRVARPIAASPRGADAVSLDLTTFDTSTQQIKRLIVIGDNLGFYGKYDGPEGMAWAG